MSALAVGGFTSGDNTQPFQVLNYGFGGAANYADGQSKIIVGNNDGSGTFNGVPVAPSDFLNGMIFNVDSNSFAVINGTIYSKGLANGGSYVSLVTNYTSAVFAATNVFYVGIVPSYFGYSLQGDYQTHAAGTIPPFPAYSTVLVSADGGATWTGNFTNVPCIVEITNAVGVNDNCSNLVIYSYVNPAQVNATNDYTTAVLYVNSAADSRSPVTLAQAQAMAAASSVAGAAAWANYPATSAVNFNGKPVSFNGTWTIIESNQTLIVQANLRNLLTITPGGSAGQPSIINTLSIVGTNLTFNISASSVPTIYYNTNLTVTNGWAVLPAQTNWVSGGYWLVSAPEITPGICFFKSATAGTNTTAATMTIAANVQAGFIFTNAAGAKFSLVVNSSTNGFNFVPQ